MTFAAAVPAAVPPFDDPGTHAILSIPGQERAPATFSLGPPAARTAPAPSRPRRRPVSSTPTTPGARSVCPDSPRRAGEPDGPHHRRAAALVWTTPYAFRPSYGACDSTTGALASARHMAVWLWDADTGDRSRPAELVSPGRQDRAPGRAGGRGARRSGHPRPRRGGRRSRHGGCVADHHRLLHWPGCRSVVLLGRAKES